MLPSVAMPSDAYRRLCHTGSTTVHCQLTATVELTTFNMRHAPNRCSDVRLLCQHSVLPASSVMTAQLDAPATLTAVFQSRDVRRLRYLCSQFFLVVHFNNISSNFVTCFDESGPIVFHRTNAICKQGPA